MNYYSRCLKDFSLRTQSGKNNSIAEAFMLTAMVGEQSDDLCDIPNYLCTFLTISVTAAVRNGQSYVINENDEASPVNNMSTGIGLNDNG